MAIEQARNILGVPATASADEIRTAYRELAKVWHPDRFANESESLKLRAREQMTVLNSAYQLLANFSPSGNAGPTESAESFGFTWGGQTYTAAGSKGQRSSPPPPNDAPPPPPGQYAYRPQQPLRQQPRKLNKVLLIKGAVFAVCILIGLFWRGNSTSPSGDDASSNALKQYVRTEPAPAGPLPPTLTPHEQRLADLRKEKEEAEKSVEAATHYFNKKLYEYERVVRAEQTISPQNDNVLEATVEAEFWRKSMIKATVKLKEVTAKLEEEESKVEEHGTPLEELPEVVPIPNPKESRRQAPVPLSGPLLSTPPPLFGSGNGPGVGPGTGDGVSAPAVISKVEAEYSEEALRAKWQGTVVLSLVVDENGTAQGIKITKSLGLGLDQKAIEAVRKWRFKPGMKDGKAVPVMGSIEVNFRLN